MHSKCQFLVCLICVHVGGEGEIGKIIVLSDIENESYVSSLKCSRIRLTGGAGGSHECDRYIMLTCGQMLIEEGKNIYYSGTSHSRPSQERPPTIIADNRYGTG